jgi:hypothetical protein
MELLNSLGKLSCLAIERAAITNMRKPQQYLEGLFSFPKNTYP